MANKITLYVTPEFVKIDVTNGVTRSVHADNITQVVAAMHPDDKMALVNLCEAVISENRKALNA